MFPIVSGIATAQSSGAAAFSAVLNNDSPAPEVPLFNSGTPSGAGELSFSITPTGGSGSYTYSWQLTITDDGGGMLSINSQGTTNQQSYDNATVVGGTNQGAPAFVEAQCTVSDGVASDIVLTSEEVGVIALY